MAQAVSAKQPNETAANETTKQQHETRIVSAPSEDVSKWKKYAVTYYRRSQKATSAPETKQANYERFCEYRDLLQAAGIETTETLETVTFKP